MLLALVTSPLAFTVTLLNVPTSVLTVASVPTAVTFALPSNDALV